MPGRVVWGRHRTGKTAPFSGDPPLRVRLATMLTWPGAPEMATHANCTRLWSVPVLDQGSGGVQSLRAPPPTPGRVAGETSRSGRASSFGGRHCPVLNGH